MTNVMDVAVDRALRGPAPQARGRLLAAGATMLAFTVLVVGGSTVGPRQNANPVLEAGLTVPALSPAGPRRLVEDLAEVVARRYRISAEATIEFVDTAVREAKRHQLDPLLILAVIAVESRFNPVAQSEFGALGLMQIIPRFHRHKLEVPGASLLDPRTNIQLGTRVLREYIERAGGETAGLQLYNGSSADTTRAYATKVLNERDRLRQAIRRARGTGA